MSERREEANRIVLSAIQRGNSVAVVGAGLPASLGFPTTDELLEKLKPRLVGFGVTSPLPDLPTAMDALDNTIRDRGRARRILRDCFFEMAPSQMFDHRHVEIARGFKYVLTTNWDCLFDLVYHCRITPSRIIPCVCPKGPSEGQQIDWSIPTSGNEHTLIKLHGTLTIPDSMIASTSDIGSFTRFTTDVGRVPFAEWLDGLLRTHQVFVIAYRLRDVDFLTAYMEALKAKTGDQEPDYFVYHKYDDAGRRAEVQEWLATREDLIQRRLKLFPGTLDEFIQGLREARPHPSDSIVADPASQTCWGRPPRASPVVGYEKEAERAARFVSEAQGTLCIVRGPAHSGLSTFASHVLERAACWVGGASAYWIEIKDYLPWHLYRYFLERHVRRAMAGGTFAPLRDSLDSARDPKGAASQLAECLARTRAQTVFILERFDQCADENVAQFFAQLVGRVQEQGQPHRIQFVVVLPDDAWTQRMPLEFFQMLQSLSFGSEIRLEFPRPEKRLSMLLTRLGIERLAQCEPLLESDSFGRRLPIGVLVPAAVLLRFFDRTAAELSRLVRRDAARPALDTLVSELATSIETEDEKRETDDTRRGLYNFMLRCAIFRTPRDEGALRTALGNAKGDPTLLADALVRYGILSHGPVDHNGEVTYAMPSGVRRVLEKHHIDPRSRREWNRQAAALYAQRSVDPSIEADEAVELLAVCFHHSAAAGDYTSFIGALQRRKRDLIAPWYMPVVGPWLRTAEECMGDA